MLTVSCNSYILLTQCRHRWVKCSSWQTPVWECLEKLFYIKKKIIVLFGAKSVYRPGFWSEPTFFSRLRLLLFVTGSEVIRFKTKQNQNPKMYCCYVIRKQQETTVWTDFFIFCFYRWSSFIPSLVNDFPNDAADAGQRAPRLVQAAAQIYGWNR